MTAVLLLCLIFNYKFMKKKSECLGIYHYRWQKIGKIMKLCIILVCLFSFSLSATTLAQRERVNMKLQDVSLRQVLEQIREQTNLQFMMSKEQGERVGRVSVDAVNETVAEVLDKIFASTGLTWVVKEDIIVVKERPQQQIQNHARVKGVVKDKKGHTLPGVTVLIKGTMMGVVTDADGNYSIELPDAKDVRLLFSFIGMKAQEVKYTGQPELNIVMQEDVAQMEEVVVTGYQTISREKVTGSTSTISSKQLEERYTPNLLDNLEGRVAGLVTYGDKTMIRGASSLSAETSPLLVVDGLPIEGKIEDINPYDVESITVLKDAAATAIYGARASNGIIVITTKKAKESGKTTIDVSANFTVYEKRNLDYAANFYMTPEQQVEKEREFFDYYFFNNGGAINDPVGTTLSYINGGKNVTPIQYAYCQLAQGEITKAELDQYLEKLKKNNFAKDYEKHILRNRFLQQYNVALRSRSEKFQSNLVVNYRHDNTGMQKAFDNRFTVFYKGTYDMASWLMLNFGINGLLSKAEESNSEYASDPFNVPAYYSLFDDNGDYSRYALWIGSEHNTALQEASGLRSMMFNHLEELQYDRLKTSRRNVRYQGELVLRIWDGLTANGSFVYETERRNEQAYSEADSYVMRLLRNLYTQKNGDDYTYLIPKEGGKQTSLKTEGEYWTARGQLNFNRTFGKHTIDFLVGGELRQTLYSGTRRLLLGYDDQLQLDATSTVDFGVLSQYETKPWWGTQMAPLDYGYERYIEPAMTPFVEQYHRYASGYANLTYTFDNKYNAFASFRKDYADIYGLDTKFRGKPLWSVGASWNLKRENFLEQAENVDFLKLRVSYGVTGNIYQGATSHMTAQSIGNNNYTRLPYSQIESPGNPSLKWEQTATVNAGVDFAFWGNRIRGSVDWYNRKGTDIFSLKNIDPTKGFTSMVMNMASLRNNGVEVSLSCDWFGHDDARRFVWRTSWTGSYNKNKITQVDIQATKAGDLIDSGLQKGYPVSALFSYRFAGMDDAGQPLFYKADGSTDEYMKVYGDLIETAVYSGQTDPKVNIGMENRFSYKGISLNVLMVYYGGHKMRVLQAGPNAKDQIPFGLIRSWNIDSWTPENTDTHVPGFGQYGAPAVSANGTDNADIYVQSADFLKIRNIVLGYDLPKNLLSRIGIHNVAFRFQIDNPKYLWVKNNVHIDPETLSLRRETSYIFGLNFNF